MTVRSGDSLSAVTHNRVIPAGRGVGVAYAAEIYIGTFSDVTRRAHLHMSVFWGVWTHRENQHSVSIHFISLEMTRQGKGRSRHVPLRLCQMTNYTYIYDLMN